MLAKIISGGQTGADQAAWRAAKAYAIPTGGWMPKGFLTEDGPRPDFAELYGALEMATASYSARTHQNVRDSHGTFWFGTMNTAGAEATIAACDQLGRPRLLFLPGQEFCPAASAAWLHSYPHITLLNIAGNRESNAPGIGDQVERFLHELFHQLGHRR
jgi:hypothetical protein